MSVVSMLPISACFLTHDGEDDRRWTLNIQSASVVRSVDASNSPWVVKEPLLQLTEDCSWRIITSETGLAHARAIVNDEGGNFVFHGDVDVGGDNWRIRRLVMTL